MRLSRRILIIGLTALLLLGVISGLDPSLPAAAQVENPPARVDSEVLESLRGGKSADFIIVMAEQADLSAAYGMADWDERGWYVYNTLKETAARTQKRSLVELKRRGVRAESFFAGNEIYVHAGSEQALNAILALGDAGSIRAPVIVQLEPAVPRFLQSIGPVRPGAALQAETQSIVDWGITDTGAPTFWSAYGRQGQGIIVANIDSGVQYDHPALVNSYRCKNGNLVDLKCWYDPTGDPQQSGPHDDQGHGTHTMGTMVGSNDPALTYTVGMAPGAQWIACRAFIGNTQEDANVFYNCADWILAPGGNASNRPNIVNNSWGGSSGNSWFRSKVQAWAASGIFTVFSAGNNSNCGTISTPGDYPESFTAASHASNGIIATDSSKGPLNYYYDLGFYLKPNISAPGVNIISSIPGSNYAVGSGTSMAAPHVSGAVALLWSCNPNLIGNISLTASLLENSARDKLDNSCGVSPYGDGNYIYGHGLLDVYAAGAGICLDWKQTYLPIIRR